MFKKIWLAIQLVFMVIAGVVLYLLFHKPLTLRGLNRAQKAAEKAAEEKYEEMSNDDVVGTLDNADDIRNTDGIPEGTIKARTSFRNRSKSLLSRLGSKGVRGEDVPRSRQGGDRGVSAGED